MELKMSSIECFNDVGCETFVLMDRAITDGVVVDTPFLRKVCTDIDGVSTVVNLDLDGKTEYTVKGEVLPPAPKVNCSATVISREMLNFPEGKSKVNDLKNGEEKCAVQFLRHYVYDCEGKVNEVYDTELDGLTPISVDPYDILPSGTNGVPSITAWEWPYEGFEQLPNNPQNNKFKMKVAHPQTGVEATIDFESAREGLYDASKQCNIKIPSPDFPKGRLTFRTGTITDDTFVGVAENTKFTFKPNEYILKNMSLLRLEFHDLDANEAVVGLTPWPGNENIVDELTNDRSTIEVNADIGGIRPYKGNKNISVLVYYPAPIPAEIYHYYNKKDTGTSCHYASFTGFTLEKGCCSGGCEESVDVGCETSLLMDRLTSGAIKYFMRKICTQPDGSITTTDTELDGQKSFQVTGTVYPAFRPEHTCPEQLTTGLAEIRNSGNTLYDLALPQEGYDLVSVKIEALDGGVTVETGGTAVELPANRTMSWEAPGPGQVLTPVNLSIPRKQVPANRAFVTWVARSKGEGSEELCDVLPPEEAEFAVMDRALTRILSNGVTVTVDADLSSSNSFGFPLMGTLKDARINQYNPGMITFSQPVDVEIGLHFLTQIDKTHAAIMPPSLQITWFDPEQCKWDATKRMLIMATKRTEANDPNPSGQRPAPALAKFKGNGVTELPFRATMSSLHLSEGLELSFMKVISQSGTFMFRRYATYDAAGNPTCYRDETPDGKPYQVKGTVGDCIGRSGPIGGWY